MVYRHLIKIIFILTWQLSNYEAHISPAPGLQKLEGPCKANGPEALCLQSLDNKAAVTHCTHSAKVHSWKCKSDHVISLAKIFPLIQGTYRIKSRFLNGQSTTFTAWPYSLSGFVCGHHIPPVWEFMQMQIRNFPPRQLWCFYIIWNAPSCLMD